MATAALGTWCQPYAEVLRARAPKPRAEDGLKLQMRRVFERLVAEQKAGAV